MDRRRSDDYPGSLLDLRRADPGDVHEVERALGLAARAGFALPPGDDGRLRRARATGASRVEPPYVVVHPGASVPARAWAPERNAELVAALAAAGRRVVVTGAPAERALTALVAGAARASTSAARPTSPGSPSVLAGADARRGRQHRPRAPRRRGRHAGRLAVRADRAGRALAPVAACRTSCCSSTSRAPAAARACARSRAIRASRASTVADVLGRASTRLAPRGGGGMRILLWHVHGSWTTAFVHGAHEYVVPVLPDRGPDGVGIARTWDWPDARHRAAARGAARRGRSTSCVLQRPHELEHLCEDWTGRRPGRDVPAVYVEHNAPQGRIAEMRHPAADRDDLLLVHVTHFNELFWDAGAHADARDRARHRRPRRALHGRAAAGRRRDQRGAAPRAGDRHRPARRFAARAPLDLFGIGARRPARPRAAVERPRRRPSCTPRWPAGASTCTRSAGPRSGSRCSRRCTSACRWSRSPRPRSLEAVPPQAGVVSHAARRARRRRCGGSCDDPDEARERGAAARARGAGALRPGALPGRLGPACSRRSPACGGAA